MIHDTTSSTTISPLTNADYQAWLQLWNAYLEFYNSELAQSTSQETWRKLLDDSVPIYGFGAYQSGKLLGITHVVLHPNTWDVTECCYLEDLFVNQSARSLGLGRKLIEQVYQFATDKNCNRVYWVTGEDNVTARKLYDTLANKTDMIQYRHNLD